MANLTNEHLEIICELQYKNLRLAAMDKLKYVLAQDLISCGIAMESIWKDGDSNDILAIRYLHLTERGQMILEQLELELNKAVMA